jgi:hypothetical protein
MSRKQKEKRTGARQDGYYGSVITPQTRRLFRETQARAYKENYLRTTKEEEQVTEDELEVMAQQYAKYQIIKEQKHYKAFLKGKDTYSYKGTRFPVMNDKFMKNTRDVKEIHVPKENTLIKEIKDLRDGLNEQGEG